MSTPTKFKPLFKSFTPSPTKIIKELSISDLKPNQPTGFKITGIVTQRTLTLYAATSGCAHFSITIKNASGSINVKFVQLAARDFKNKIEIGHNICITNAIVDAVACSDLPYLMCKTTVVLRTSPLTTITLDESAAVPMAYQALDLTMVSGNINSCFGFVTGIDDPISVGKSTCTKVQLSNDADVEANLYLYGAVGRQFDVDVTTNQNSTGQTVMIGLIGVKIQSEYQNSSALKISLYNDSTIELNPGCAAAGELRLWLSAKEKEEVDRAEAELAEANNLDEQTEKNNE